MSTVLLAAGLVSVYIDMNDRIDHNVTMIASNTQEIQHTRTIHEKDREHDERLMLDMRERNEAALRNIDATFDKIDKKLDKLIDKQHTHD